MEAVSLARHAMATRFELVLHGPSALALRAAGEEALDEVVRLENQLSLFRPGSEIAQLNSRAAHEAVSVSPEVFALLQHARKLSEETGGAFDITIAPLVCCWGFMEGQGRLPTAQEIAAARDRVGMNKVELDPVNRTVRFSCDGVMLDLGAIGKGYAVERAGSILREAGVTSALIHGGTSTVCAIGHPPDADDWRIALDVPAECELLSLARSAVSVPRQPADPTLGAPITIPLRNASLSVSAASGRYFKFAGKLYSHVIDPRTGLPTETALLAAIVQPSATETDALSTALLTLGLAGQDQITSLRAGMKSLVVGWRENTLQAASFGL